MTNVANIKSKSQPIEEKLEYEDDVKCTLCPTSTIMADKLCHRTDKKVKLQVTGTTVCSGSALFVTPNVSLGSISQLRDSAANDNLFKLFFLTSLSGFENIKEHI